MEIRRESWVVLFGCWPLAVKEAEPVGSLPCWNCVLEGIREGTECFNTHPNKMGAS